ncbi:MAG TPA: hypothetical protein VGR28_06460 [Candidatus Thermoplasmatota archaeon]|jgi:hypothetical protein|nr:hypothetical protein [Candidatus Thermoplasmatota archaeon]
MTRLGPSAPAFAAALLTCLATASPAAAATAVAGTGQGATFSFCDPTVDIIMAGASLDGASWTFLLTMFRSPADGCSPILYSAYQGAWSPAAGGCLASVLPADASKLCVDAVALPGPATTRWRICSLGQNPCEDFYAFWVGTVSLAGA